MIARPNIKFPTKGMSGTAFLVLWFVILAFIFGIGTVFIPPSGVVVARTFGKLEGYAGELAIKFLIVSLIALFQTYLLFTHVLDAPLSRLKERFARSHNDSHAYLLVGIVGAGIAAVTMSNGASLAEYFYQLCTRAAIGYAVATILTIFLARLFGVRSMDEFRDWIDAEDNDSYAILVSGTMIGSMALAMGV